jgi:hypothetical protein
MNAGIPKPIANRIANAPHGKTNTPTKRMTTTAVHSPSHARLQCSGAVLVRMTSIIAEPLLQPHQGTRHRRCQTASSD